MSAAENAANESKAAGEARDDQQVVFDNASSAVQDAEAELAAREAALQTANSNLESKQEEIKSINGDIAQKQSELPAAELLVDGIEADLVTLNTDLAAEEATLAVLGSAQSDAQTAVETARAAKSSAEDALAEASTTLASLALAAETAANESKAAGEARDDQQVVFDNASNAVQNAETELAAREGTLDVATSDTVAQQSVVDGVNTQIALKGGDLSAAQAAVTAIGDTLADAQLLAGVQSRNLDRLDTATELLSAYRDEGQVSGELSARAIQQLIAPAVDRLDVDAAVRLMTATVGAQAEAVALAGAVGDTDEAGLAAQISKLEGDLAQLGFVVGFEQEGLISMQANLDKALATLTSAQAEQVNAQTAYDTGRAAASADFLTSYPDPATLVAGVSVVDGSQIDLGALSLDVGDTWTQANIDTLQAEMDDFVAVYEASPGATVANLEGAVADANGQLSSAEDAVGDAEALYAQQAAALAGYEAQVAETQASLLAAQTALTAIQNGADTVSDEELAEYQESLDAMRAVETQLNAALMAPETTDITAILDAAKALLVDVVDVHPSVAVALVDTVRADQDIWEALIQEAVSGLDPSVIDAAVDAALEQQELVTTQINGIIEARTIELTDILGPQRDQAMSEMSSAQQAIVDAEYDLADINDVALIVNDPSMLQAALALAEITGTDPSTQAANVISRLEPEVVAATIRGAVVEQTRIVDQGGEDPLAQAALGQMLQAESSLLAMMDAGQDYTAIVDDVIGLLFEVDSAVLVAAVGAAQQAQQGHVAALNSETVAITDAQDQAVTSFNDAEAELQAMEAAKATLDTVIADLGGLDVLLEQVLSSGGDPDAIAGQDGLGDALEAMLTVGVSLLTTVDIAGVDIDPTAAVNILEATRAAQQAAADDADAALIAGQSELPAAELLVDGIEADLVTLNTDLAAEEATLAVLGSAQSDAQTAVETARAAKSSAEDALAEASTTLASLALAAETAANESKAAGEARDDQQVVFDNASNAVQNAETELAAREGTLDVATSDTVAQQSVVDGVNTQIALKGGDLSAAQAAVTAIGDTLATLGANLGSAQSALADLEIAQANAQTDLETARNTKSDADDAQAAAGVMLTSLTNAATMASGVATAAENARDDQQDVVNNAHTALEGAEADLSSAMANLSAVQSQYGTDTLNVDEVTEAQIVFDGVDPDTASIDVTVTDADGTKIQLSASNPDGSGWAIEKQDLSGLADGGVMVEAVLTDGAGNQVLSSDTFTKDTTADLEDDTVLAVTVDSVINDEESGDVTLTLSGVDADVVSVGVTLTDDNDVSVTATAVAGNNGDWTVDVSGGALIDGNVSVAVDMTDDAGNTASAATSFDLDTTADAEDDTVLAVSVDSVINDAESGDVTLTLSGVDADADSVTVTLTDGEGTAVTAAAVAGNNGDWTVDVSGGALIDGNVSVAVDMTDDAGNTASASTSFDLDTTADLEDGAVLTVAAVDADINDAESGAVTLTLSGVDADAETVTVTLTDGEGTAVTAAAVAGNNGDWTVDVSGGALIDGAVSVAVDMTDDAGNTASASTSFDLDTTADLEDDTVLAVSVGSVINDEESDDVTLTLSGVDADAETVTVTLTDGEGTAVTAAAVAGNNGDWTVDVSGGALIDGNVSVAVDMTDTSGNSASASTSFDLDTTADLEDGAVLTVAAVDADINDAESGAVTLTLSGVDADAETVTVTLTDGEGTAVTAAAVAGNNGDWTVDVSGGALIDGAVSVAVDMTDDAGNTASASTSFDLDTTADLEDGAVLTVAAVDADINDAESGAVTLTLSGVDADAETVTVTLTDGEGTAVTAAAVAGNNGDWTVDVSGGALIDGAVSVAVDMTDTSGNSASASTSFDLDTTADLEDGAVLTVAAVDADINDAESGAVTLTLSGVDADAETVTVTLTDGEGTAVTAAAVAGNNGDWTVDVSGGALIDGNVSVAVDMTDTSGNSASASTSFDLDTTADEAGDLSVTVDTSGDGVINDAESGAVTLTLSGVDADAETVTVTLTDGEGTAVTAAAVAGNNGDWMVDVSGGALIDGNVSVAVDMTDTSGNSASAATDFILDTAVIPPAELEVSVAHAMMTAEEAETAFTISTEPGSSWKVTLTGSNYIAAVSAEAEAEQVHADAETALADAQADESAAATVESDAVQAHADAETALASAVAVESAAATVESDAAQAHADAETALASAQETESAAAQAEAEAAQAHADAETALASAQADESLKANVHALESEGLTTMEQNLTQAIEVRDTAQDALELADSAYQQAYDAARQIGIGESVDPDNLEDGQEVAETLTLTADELAGLGIDGYIDDQIIEQGSTWSPETIALAELVIHTGAEIAAAPAKQAVTDAGLQLQTAQDAVDDAQVLYNTAASAEAEAEQAHADAETALASAQELESAAAQTEADAAQAHADAETALAGAQETESAAAQTEADAAQAHADAETALASAQELESAAAQAEADATQAHADAETALASAVADESAAATAEADAEQAIIDATVVKTGTGTGSAEVVSLDATDLAALGDGQVTVESEATDAAGNTALAATSFDLDTTADLEDGAVLTGRCRGCRH